VPKLVERLPNHAFVLNAVGVVYLRLAERHGDPALARQAADYLLRAAEMRQTVKTPRRGSVSFSPVWRSCANAIRTTLPGLRVLRRNRVESSKPSRPIGPRLML
jgi:hypothetical protein